jgi:hypothetical protein
VLEIEEIVARKFGYSSLSIGYETYVVPVFIRRDGPQEKLFTRRVDQHAVAGCNH